MERYFKEKGSGLELPTFVSTARTFIFVLLGWVTFRAEDFGAALELYGGMLGANGLLLSSALSWQLTYSGLLELFIGLFIVFVAPSIKLVSRPSGLRPLNLSIIPLFVLGALRVTAEAGSPFLYFQF